MFERIKKLLRKFNSLVIEAAHKILAEKTLHPESLPKLESESDNYENLALELSKGNWNQYDIQQIKELAGRRCRQKLFSPDYQDIQNDLSEEEIIQEIESIMKSLGLLE